jgi:hypothetical protein
MNIKASGRSALIITAGFWLCFAGPMRGTESNARTADSTARTESATGAPIVLTRQHPKKQATAHSRNSSKTAKTSDGSKGVDGKKADDAAAEDATPTNIPPSVANANAQLQTGDTAAADAAKNMSTQADNVLKNARQGPAPADVAAATTELVSADQLNEVDRSLSEDKPAPTLAMALTPTTSSSASSDDSTWGQTSLIGKVFIAFGGLLTLASAARMFMA